MVSKLTPKTIIIVFIFFLLLGFINEKYFKHQKQNTIKNINPITQLIKK